MSNWNLKFYNDKEIKTQEDIMWLCKEVVKAYKKGNPEIKDQMALAFLEELHKEHIEKNRIGFIENRFEILDL